MAQKKEILLIQDTRKVCGVVGGSFGDVLVSAMLQQPGESVQSVVEALLQKNIPPKLAMIDPKAMLPPLGGKVMS